MAAAKMASIASGIGNASANVMLPLDYYFSKASSQPDDSSRSEPIVIVIDKKKHPIGRPLKAAPSAPSKRMKLVDYSSSSESELENISSTSRSTTKNT